MLRTAGLDIARSTDYAAIVIGAIAPNRTYTVEHGYRWPRAANRDTPYYSVLINGSKEGNTPGVLTLYKQWRWMRIGIDATGFGDAMPEALKAKGIPNEGMNFSNTWKNDGINLLMILVHEKRIKIPKEMSDLKTQMLEQMRLQGAPGTSGTTRYAHPQGHHDDLFWALILALMVARPVLLKGPTAIGVGTMGAGQDLQIMRISTDPEIQDILSYCSKNGVRKEFVEKYRAHLVNKYKLSDITLSTPGFTERHLMTTLTEWEKAHSAII